MTLWVMRAVGAAEVSPALQRWVSVVNKDERRRRGTKLSSCSPMCRAYGTQVLYVFVTQP